MTVINVNKLVRDKIPEKIERRLGTANIEILNDDEYKQALIDKMYEETSEFKSDQNLEVLADMYSVLCAIAKAFGFNMCDVYTAAKEKTVLSGDFDKRIFLKSYIERDGIVIK